MELLRGADVDNTLSVIGTKMIKQSRMKNLLLSKLKKIVKEVLQNLLVDPKNLLEDHRKLLGGHRGHLIDLARKLKIKAKIRRATNTIQIPMTFSTSPKSPNSSRSNNKYQNLTKSAIVS